MPIPKPKKGESQDDFIGRCMDAIGDEYDDKDQALAICYDTWRDKDKKSLEPNELRAASVNGKGVSHAKSLVRSGKVDKESGWSFSADDGNKILGDNNWSEYAKWFLATDSSQSNDTKAHYKYPFGKNGKVYRSAIIAAKQRASAQNSHAIANVANQILEMIDGKEKKNEERRTVTPLEFRIETDGDQKRIVGYPAVFNKLSEPMLTMFGPTFKEKIRAGAFKKALEGEPDIRALFNHNPDLILGRTISGTLEIKERTRGLWSSITPPDTQTGKDVVKSIERGDITQMSFGFTIDKDEWFEDEEGNVTRTIVSVDRLFDISPVTFPAYADTEVAVRSMQKWIEGGKQSIPEFMRGYEHTLDYSREKQHHKVRKYWEDLKCKR